MDVAEICPLSQEAVAELLAARMADRGTDPQACRRRSERWSFPGTVELWRTTREGETHEFATSINLSTTGVGVRADDELVAGEVVGIALHEPEVSFHGKAVVRHCTETDRGYFIAGLEFLFDTP